MPVEIKVLTKKVRLTPSNPVAFQTPVERVCLDTVPFNTIVQPDPV